MRLLAIGEVSRRSGIPASTIRYYEEIGLLPPRQLVNGKRRYDTSIFDKLNLIRLAQQIGFTNAEIQILLHQFPTDTPPSERWQALASQKMAELDERMRQILTMKALLTTTMDCRCVTLEDCAVGIAAVSSAIRPQGGSD